MASSNDWTGAPFTNPLLLQSLLLERFEKDTNTVVVDPNNPASVLMEGFVTMAASAVRQMDDTVRPAIYPARASTTADLYKHISDYDYVDIFSSPAETTLMLIVDKDYVTNNALPVPIYAEDGETVTGYQPYRKITIPSTTTFTIGDYAFGIYYPIDLRINNQTGNFTVVYDSSERNPLKTLQTNTLEYDFRWYNNLSLVYIKIPVYQFKIKTAEYSLVMHSGFKEAISYDDKFYALRCKSEVLTNYGHDASESDIWELKELNLAMAGQTYDPETPTVVFTPDLENNQIVCEIPYVYFSEGRIRGNILIDVYTTVGELNYQIPFNTEEIATIDMFTNLTDTSKAEYAYPFRTMPALNAVPLNTQVVGGANGMSFEDLRKRVVTGTLKSKTLQTPADIEAYFDNNGYIATKLKDGITDRIFICHSTLRNSANEVVGADTVGTIFDFNDVDKYSTIIKSGEDTYTILPSTLYKYDQDKGVCYPLTDAEMTTIEAMSAQDKVDTFNSNVFTLSPFYLQLSAKDRYPTSVTYDLQDNKIVEREFMGEREDVPYQLIMNTVSFQLLHQVKDKYYDCFRLIFRIGRTELTDVPAVVSVGETAGQKNIRVLVALKNDDGNYYFEEAKWNYKTDDDYDIFYLDIPFTSVFHQANNDHTMVLTFGKGTAGEQLQSDFLLRSEARIMLLLNNEIEDLKYQMSEDIWLGTDYSDTPFDNIRNCVCLSEHRLVLQFGSVVDELDQRINLTYSEAEYQKYCDTQFMTLKEDVYKRDEYGNLEYKWWKANDTPWVRGTDADNLKHHVTLELLHNAGLLKSMTETIDEQVVVNDLIRATYDTLEYRTDDKQVHQFKATDGSVEGSATPNGLYNFLANPIVPRFAITNDVYVDESVSSYLDKKFEMVNPRGARDDGFAGYEDKWASQGTENIKTLVSDNALLYILRDIFGFDGDISKIQSNPYFINGNGIAADAENDESPLKDVQAEVGSIICVYNDGTMDVDYFCPDITPIEESAYSCVRLYMLTENGWISIARASTVLDMYNQALKDADPESTDYTDSDGVDKIRTVNSYPQTHGFVYAFYDYKRVPSILNPEGDYEEVVPETPIVAFLTNRVINGCVVPALDRLDMLDYAEVPHGTKKKVGVQYFTRAEDPTKARYVATTFDADETPVTKKKAGTDEIIPVYTITGSGVYVVSSATVVDPTTTYFIKVPFYTYSPFTGESFVAGTTYYTQRQNIGWEEAECGWPWDVSTWHIGQKTTINDREEQIFAFTPKTTITLRLSMPSMQKYCAHISNQHRLDDAGNLIPDETKPRHIQYMVDMLHVDAKLSFTTANSNDRTYPDSLVDVMEAHFDKLGKARNQLFTNTRLFFSPVKSIGTSEFAIGDGNNITLPLDVTLKFRLRVSQATSDDETTRDTIREQIIEIIDDYVDENGIINCVEIARRIRENLSETVQWVDVLGIDGDPSLQTMKSINPEAVPHLKHILTLLDDGKTISVDRGLELEIVVQE